MKTGGLQVMDFFLRFHVAPSEADTAIQNIVDNNNQKMKRTLLFPTTVLPIQSVGKSDKPVEHRPVESDIPMWWEVKSIKKGFRRTEGQSYAPTIWYDADSSFIFVRQCD